MHGFTCVLPQALRLEVQLVLSLARAHMNSRTSSFRNKLSCILQCCSASLLSSLCIYPSKRVLAWVHSAARHQPSTISGAVRRSVLGTRSAKSQLRVVGARAYPSYIDFGVTHDPCCKIHPMAPILAAAVLNLSYSCTVL